MENERKLRLIQVAKEFKVGLNTISDFLRKKGVAIDGSPNTQISGDAYALIEREFGSNRTSTSARDSVREKISTKQATVSIEEPKPQPKRNIEVRDQIPQQPRILGRVELDKKGNVVKPKAEQPAAPAPKPEQPKAEPKPAAAAPAPAPKPAADVAPQQSPAEAQPSGSQFRPTEAPTLSGPQILGKMDVTGMVPGGKHRRKKIAQEKVDITRQQPQQQGGGNKKNKNQGQGNNNNPQNRPNNNNNNNNQQQGGGKKKHQKPQPKPVVRPEVSDEEVSKQVKDTLARLTAKGAKNKGAKYRKEKREEVRERMNEAVEREEMERKVLKVTEFVTVSELATMMNVSHMEVISACMNLGLMVSINQRLDAEALVVVAEEFGFTTEFVSVEIQEAIGDEEIDEAEDLLPRPPIVTVMGHVDHGKTSLLDNIRKTNVIAGEAGGITQHIGAYSVELNGQKITFLDTPGHEAFTAMRARGAKITDVAIIIVAADDSVMPQTIEAINHAQAAGVPMVFAINKIDKPAANVERIKEQLAGMNFLVEDWGGKYQSQDVSAKQGLNLEKLLEKVLLEAELLDLKANPN